MSFTIPVSTVPAATAALIAAIEAQIVAGNDTVNGTVYVFDGDPPTPDMPDDYILVGSDIDVTTTPIAEVHGWQAGSLGEEYDITVWSSSWSGSALAAKNQPDPETVLSVRQRTWALHQYVVNAVRVDLSLAGTVTVARPAARAQAIGVQWTGDPIGAQCWVKQRIHCAAQI